MSQEIKPVRIGMMSFAHMHATSYAASLTRIPDAELVGIADDNPERGKDMAKRFKTQFFGSYEELLQQDIHAVIVCSENIKHKDLVIKAADAGKHILCEKPLATNIEDGKEMINHCKKHGIRLQTAFPFRFSPAMIQAHQAVMTGQIGKILAIKGANRSKCPGGWFTDLEQSGGGAVIDLTVNVADLIRWITGAEIDSVYAEISNRINHKDFDDAATLTLTMNNGVFATIDPGWSKPESYPFWGDVTLTIVGTDGAIWVDLFKQKMNLYSDQSSSGSWEYWGDDIDMLMVKAFVNSVAFGLPVEPSGEDGLAALTTVVAAYESANRRIPIKTVDIGCNPAV
jgi:UDP-N-acetylglucosamine 3-dehydrogenase